MVHELLRCQPQRSAVVLVLMDPAELRAPRTRAVADRADNLTTPAIPPGGAGGDELLEVGIAALVGLRASGTQSAPLVSRADHSRRYSRGNKEHASHRSVQALWHNGFDPA